MANNALAPFVGGQKQPDDPWAAIRRLGSDAFVYQAPSEQWGGDSVGTVMSQGQWDVGQSLADSPFGSKYMSQGVRDLGDGRMAVTMQQPGGHKYDTMEVIYTRQPDGSYAMQGDPSMSRQVSSSQRIRDDLEPIAAIGAALGGAYFGASALGLGEAAGAAGATGVGGAGGVGGGMGLGSAGSGIGSAVAAAGSAAPSAGGLAGAAGAAGGGMSGWWNLANLGAQIGGSLIQDRAARGAADAVRDSNAAAINEQRRQYDQTRTDFEPWRAAGRDALGQLSGDISRPVTAEEVMQDPGYQFGLNQGQQAIDRRIAAMGGRVSGQAIKAAGRFGTDYASTGFNAAYQRRQDRLNRLASIAGIGQTATGASAQAGANATNAISGLLSNTGEQVAGGRLARGSIWGDTANQLGAAWLRRPPPSNPLGSLYGAPDTMRPDDMGPY